MRVELWQFSAETVSWLREPLLAGELTKSALARAPTALRRWHRAVRGVAAEVPAVMMSEPSPPRDCQPLEWLLLSNDGRGRVAHAGVVQAASAD